MLGVVVIQVVLKIKLLNHLEKPGEKLFLVLLEIIFGVLKLKHLHLEDGGVAVRQLLQRFKELNLLRLKDGVLALLMVGELALLLLVEQITVLVILGDKIQILVEGTVERVASNVVKKATCQGNVLKEEVEDSNVKEEGILLHRVVVLNVVKKVTCQENVQMLLRRSQVASNAVKRVICHENVLKVEVVVIAMGSNSSKNELALNVEMKITCLENVRMQVEVEILNKNVHASNVEMNLICRENVRQLVEITVEDRVVLEEEHASNVEKMDMFRRIVLRIKVHRNVLIAKVKVICRGNVRMNQRRGKDALTVEMNRISRENAHKNEKKDQIDRIMEIQEEVVVEETIQEIVLGSNNLQNHLGHRVGVLQMPQEIALLVQDGDNLEVMLQEVVLQQEQEEAGAHQLEDRILLHNQEEEVDGVHLQEVRILHHLQEEEVDGVHQPEVRVLHHLQEEEVDGVHLLGIKLKVLVQVLKLGVTLLTTKSLLQVIKMKMDDLEDGDHKLHPHLIILHRVGVNLLQQEKQQQEQVVLNHGGKLIAAVSVVVIIIILVDGQCIRVDR